MADQKDMALILKDFLEKSIATSGRIHEDSKKAKDLIGKLKKSTDYKAILERASSEMGDFLEQSHAFTNAIKDWTVTFPEFLKGFKQILNTLIIDLKKIDYIIERDFPRFSITFDGDRFEYDIKEGKGMDHELMISERMLAEIKARERKLTREVAEIILLDFAIERGLQRIEQDVIRSLINEKCDYITSNRNIDGKFIDNLSEIVIEWTKIGELLIQLGKTIYTAVELDEIAIKELKKLTKEEKIIGLEEDDFKVIMAGLGVLGRVALEALPITNAISATMTAFEGKRELKEAMRVLKKAARRK
jgi:hypothetical protein|tara:strand:+ start:588 stop:1499 length:912 start_codon:yes stop_codon:yes gene_type:complete